jgi:integrase
MEQTHCPTSRNLPLGRLVADALGEIELLGYSRRSRNRYRAIWNHLIEFSHRKELGDDFSADLAARFLEEYRVSDEQVDEPGEGWRRHMVFGIKVLADFAENGRVEHARIVSDVRSFLRFLTLRGILQKDLSVELPKIRVPRDATMPSVWDHELVVRLLEAVDRSSAKGKRDYAILLLACRLGLCAGDIRTLNLDQIYWEDSTIEITQSKTTMPLSLPLTNEVGEALIDYLKAGRPQTEHREVFLKVNPPFDPFKDNNLHHIVTYWRRLTRITFRSPQKRGIHSLRHTLATRLLEKGTPFTTIAEILGHTSLESTRIYAKADVEALRSVALDPEEVNHAE